MSASERYQLKHPVRIVTAASLFDGHDAAINIMRRLLQRGGAEVIHLGHNRSVREIVDCALQEDAQGVAITSYQGGHLEFFKYMRRLFDEAGADVRIYGGGGGTILPTEIAELHAAGIDRIYSPDDGREMGLQGMIDAVLAGCASGTWPPHAPRPSWPSPAPAAPASPPWSTSWSGAGCTTSTRACSRSSASIRASARRAARCSATASA